MQISYPLFFILILVFIFLPICLTTMKLAAKGGYRMLPVYLMLAMVIFLPFIPIIYYFLYGQG